MDQKTLERARYVTQFKWPAIKNDQSLLYELWVLHSKVKNETACCDLRPFYDELKILIEPQIPEPKMKSENFELNDKEMILIHSKNEYINNDNLTDAFAVDILKEDPAKISRFKKFPDNWEEFVENFSDEAVPATDKPVKAKAPVKAPAAPKSPAKDKPAKAK